MDISFLKKNCGAKIEGKKRSDKLICGNGIAKKKDDKLICGNNITEIDHNQVICDNGIAKNTLTN